MNLLNFCARIFVDWCVVSCIVVGAYIVAVARMKSRTTRPDDTQRAAYPPPVPHRPVTQADIDATWLSVWPTAVDEDDLMNREFVSLISETWDWTDPAEGVA